MMTHLASNLRAIRGRRGLTLSDLAQASGINVSTLCCIEQGSQRAQVATVAKLAGALGMSIEELEGPPAAASPTAGNGQGGGEGDDRAVDPGPNDHERSIGSESCPGD